MTRDEYEKRAAEFRAFLNAEGEKPHAEQRWPEPDEWLSIPGTAVCTTPTCDAFNQALPTTLHENADGIFRGWCGGCETATTVVPIFEED
jgi:hypothetical protein